MPASQIVAFDTVTLTDNQTRYVTPAGTLNEVALADELIAQLPIRDAGVMDQAYVYVAANAITTTTPFAFRVSGVNSAVGATIGSDQTGGFQDVTNTAALVATDEVDWQFAPGSEAGTNVMRVTVTAWRFVPTNPAHTIAFAYTGGSGTSITNASAERYLAPCGTIAHQGTETLAKARIRGAFTARNLGVYVTLNNRTTNTAFITRKTGGDGTQLVLYGSGQTGVVEDATNSDTLAAGDDFNYVATTSTGTQSIAVRWICTAHVSTARQWTFFLGTVNGVTVSGSLDQYAGLAGNGGNFLIEGIDLETSAQLRAEFAFTLKEFTCFVTTNTMTTNTVFSTRLNAANGAVTATIGGGVTNTLFSDTTHSDAVAVDDLVNVRFDQQAGSGNLSVRMITLIGETVGSSFVPFPRPRGLSGGMHELSGGLH
jgi:hypothetical protein